METININGVSINVDSNIVANVERSKEFCIADGIHVRVDIYVENGRWMMTSWLINGGCDEELNTENVNDKYEPSMQDDEVTAMMEQFVHDNEEYIIDIANWDGE